MRCSERVMEMQIVRDKKSRFYDVAFYAAVILVYHLLMREYSGDAVLSFSKFMENNTLIGVLQERYLTWTSRVIIEIPLILLAQNMHIVLWKIFDIAIWIVLALALFYLTHHKNDRMVLGLILVYPVTEMASAGWMPTTINYLWPLTACCLALISLDKMYHGKRIYWFEAIGYLLLEMFATNFETVGVMYGCILVYYALHFFLNRKPQVRQILFWLLQILIAGGNVIFALTCPGNFARKQANISFYIKDYVQWTKVDQFIMGVNTTMQGAVDSNILFLVFAVVLGGVCCCLLRDKVCRGMALALLAFTAARTILKPVMAVYFPVFNALFDAGTKVDAANYYRLSLYFPFVVYMALICMMVIMLLHAAAGVRDGVKYAVLFTTGILTRIIMGFSPTLYASANRTYIFWDFTLLFLTAAIAAEYKEKIVEHGRIYAVLRYSFAVVVGVAVVGNLMAINN